MKKKKKVSCAPQCNTECNQSKAQVTISKECKPCEVVCEPCETKVCCTPITGCKPNLKCEEYYCECPPECEIQFCD